MALRAYSLYIRGMTIISSAYHADRLPEDSRPFKNSEPATIMPKTAA